MSAFEQIEVRVVEAADYDRVLDFLRLHYYRDEPLTIGSEPKKQDAADEEYSMSKIANGTCLMAVQAENDYHDEIIIGLTLAGPKGPDEENILLEEAAKYNGTKWGRILEFMASWERDANVCERYGVNRVLHGCLTCVDRQQRAKGLATVLIRNLMELGQLKNYPLLTADCTSAYSARLRERLGWDCVNTVAYKDYKDSNGRQIFNPPAPHTCVKTYAIRL